MFSDRAVIAQSV